MYEPYEGEPGNTGIAMSSPDKLLELIERANRAGISTMTHAIGDRATETILDIHVRLEEILETTHKPGLKNRLEHFQLITEKIIPKLKKIPIVASVQPIHIFSDWSAADRFWGKRSRFAYALRTIKESGMPLVFGSDSPVESVNPFWGMYAAVERKDLNGEPEKGWYPEQRMTPMESLLAYCLDPPRIVGEGQSKGSLIAGKRADFVLVDHDPLTEPPDVWRNTRVLATANNGEFVYREF
jgi:predicted amidohydrolase YtcJ